MERELVLVLGYMDNVALAKYQAMHEEGRRNYEDYIWLSEVHHDLAMVAGILEHRNLEMLATACDRLIDKYRWYMGTGEGYGLMASMERWWKYVNLEEVLGLLGEIKVKVAQPVEG